VRKKNRQNRKKRLLPVLLTACGVMVLAGLMFTAYGDSDPGIIYGVLTGVRTADISLEDRKISIFGKDDYILPEDLKSYSISGNGGEGIGTSETDGETAGVDDPGLIYGTPITISENDERLQITVALNQTGKSDDSYRLFLNRLYLFVRVKNMGYDDTTAAIAAVSVDDIIRDLPTDRVASLPDSVLEQAMIRPYTAEAEAFLNKWSGYEGKGLDLVGEGLQYLGYPYVYGGNSLTAGIDCSHYVWQILLRTGHYDGPYTDSAGFRELGTEVSYEDMRPGDVLCWKGHVAFYLGDSYILNAASPELGICVMNVDIRNLLGGLLTVRRFE